MTIALWWAKGSSRGRGLHILSLRPQAQGRRVEQEIRLYLSICPLVYSREHEQRATTMLDAVPYWKQVQFGYVNKEPSPDPRQFAFYLELLSNEEDRVALRA